MCSSSPAAIDSLGQESSLPTSRTCQTGVQARRPVRLGRRLRALPASAFGQQCTTYQGIGLVGCPPPCSLIVWLATILQRVSAPLKKADLLAVDLSGWQGFRRTMTCSNVTASLIVALARHYPGLEKYSEGREDAEGKSS